MDLSMKCVCCLDKEPERDLNSTYLLHGKGENYAEMIKECFDIDLAVQSDMDGICEVCISRLRDACDFKTQVQTCQRHFTTGAYKHLDSKGKLPMEIEQVWSDSYKDTHLGMPTEDNINKIVKTEKCDYAYHMQETNENNTESDLQIHNSEESNTGTQSDINSEVDDIEKKNDEDFKRYTKCTECSYMNLYKSVIEKHMRFHDIKRKFVCNDCGYRFNTKSSLTNHIITKRHSALIYPLSNNVKSCESPTTCDKEVSKKHSKNKSKKHSKDTTHEKAHKCDLCDYRSACVSKLKVHQRSHTGEKPYACEFCDLRYAQASTLKIHQTVHTGEKPYKCEFCDFRNGNLGRLKVHQRIHTGEKPYKCPFCDYTCARGGNMVVHKRIHTGEKPYKCTFCNFESARLSSVKKHETRFHNFHQKTIKRLKKWKKSAK